MNDTLAVFGSSTTKSTIEVQRHMVAISYNAKIKSKKLDEFFKTETKVTKAEEEEEEE